MSKTPSRMGRPPKAPEERKGGNLTIRLRGGAREMLAQAVETTHRSLSEEIEHRVVKSFEWDRAWRDVERNLPKLVEILSDEDVQEIEHLKAEVARLRVELRAIEDRARREMAFEGRVGVRPWKQALETIANHARTALAKGGGEFKTFVGGRALDTPFDVPSDESLPPRTTGERE